MPVGIPRLHSLDSEGLMRHRVFHALRVQRYEHATTLMAPSQTLTPVVRHFLSVRRRVISLEKPDPVGCTVKGPFGR